MNDVTLLEYLFLGDVCGFWWNMWLPMDNVVISVSLKALGPTCKMRMYHYKQACLFMYRFTLNITGDFIVY